MEYVKNLDKIEKQIINKTEKYFCIVRKSFVPATPEEKVRQNFLKYLIEEKGFPIEKIRVEESLTHYGKGNRRVDILILDLDNIPFIIYECKKEFEPLTDEVIDQALDYFNKLETVDYLGIVIGNNLDLIAHQENQKHPLINIEQPDYKTLISGGEISVYEVFQGKYKRNEWRKPVSKEIINELINYGVVGDGTEEKFFSFLVNLDGWLLDEKDKLIVNKNIEDIGIKVTKFGSAGGGFFSGEYRSFVIKNQKNKPIVSISLTAMSGGKNSPIGTVILVGIESSSTKNSSLELRINKAVRINKGNIEIFHNGTITVGKLGATKRQELLDFVFNRKPSLIRNNEVFLGSFKENEEITSKNVSDFIQNTIDYALIRNEFREYKKSVVNN